MACTGGLAATRCKKQQAGLCGLPWERPMYSSRLQRADDGDKIFCIGYPTKI